MGYVPNITKPDLGLTLMRSKSEIHLGASPLIESFFELKENIGERFTGGGGGREGGRRVRGGG